MLNAVIGALRVVLGMDSAAFNDGVGAAEKRVAAFRKSMEQAGRSMTRVGTRMSAAVTAPLIGLAYKSVAAQREQERAIAAVSTALESMGDGAGYTLSQLEAMASKLQEGSLYGDEEILTKVTANLLTFGNVQGEVFERAQQMAVDLSARLGQDLQSSAIMLGKALNDPVKGLSALSRVGVSFTEEQKEQIKAMAKVGDVAGAQALMLAELERQYAAQAAALAATDSGRITQAMNAIGDATEKVGAVLLPVLADFADYVKSVAERFQTLSPETQKFIVVAGGVAAALGPVLASIGLMMTALAPMAGVILAVVSPLGLLTAALTAAAVAIYSNWDSLKSDFPAITGVLEAAVDGLKAAFQVLLEVGAAVFGGIVEHGRLLVQGVEALFSGDFRGALNVGRQIIDNFAETARAAFQALFGVDFLDLMHLGVDAVRQFGSDLVAALQQMLADVVNAALEIGREIVAGIKQGLQEKWQDLKGYVSGLGDGIAQGFQDVLGIRSPSRVFKSFGGHIIDGLVLGLKGGFETVAGAVAELSGVLRLDGLEGNPLQKMGDDAEALEKRIGDINEHFGQMFKDVASGAKNFGDVMSDVLSRIGSGLMSSAFSGLTSALGLGDIFSGLPGFATGGSFEVGGAGGIDSQVVAFRASPNETVHITKPGQGLSAAPAITYAPVIDARGADSAAVARLEAGMQRAQAEFAANVVTTVRDAQKKRHL